MPFDKVTYSSDPGAHIFDDKLVTHNNLNRQLVSTNAGLDQVKRKYTLKFRSDMVLTGNGFLNFFDRFRDRSEQWKILEKRVLVSTVYTRNPRRLFRLLFHPSDWVSFGLTEDVKKMWDVPLAKEPEFSRWFENRLRPQPDHWPRSLIRYYPEQYLWLYFLNKYSVKSREIDFRHHSDFSPELMEISETTMANNLVFLEPKQYDVVFLKYKIKLSDRASLYSHMDWKRLYYRYCSRKQGVDAGIIKHQFMNTCKYIYSIIIKLLRKLKWSRFVRVILYSSKQHFPGTYNAVKGKYEKYKSFM